MKKLLILVVVACIIGISPVIINAWIGSEPSVGIGYPDTNDDVAIPFTPRGWCWNTDQGIYYYEIWLIHDVNADSEISEGEFDDRVVVHKQYGFNILKYDLPLTPRYVVDSTLVDQDGKYFLFIYAVDMVGDVSADTNIIGLTPLGDGTRTESMLRYFTAQGYRP